MNATETGYPSTVDLESALNVPRPPTASTRSARAVAPVPPVSQDENWLAWYAAYMVAEQAGTDLPS